MHTHTQLESTDRSVKKVIEYGLGDHGSVTGRGPPSFLSNLYLTLFTGVWRPKRETEHSPAYTHFMEWRLSTETNFPL